MKTWKDIYKLPVKLSQLGSHVYDSHGNFVFQFEPIYDSKGNYAEGYKQLEKSLIACINGESIERTNNLKATHNQGEIFIGDVHLITIRGWGNLTGVGGHRLSEKEAANVQDTFAEYIVERLNEGL